tara:strand:+ start:1315 stop:2004 length:690 start_codon:yes stop_codon:yes gene_type:complete
MPVFFVHDVNHGIVKPLDRKFRVREINPASEVSRSQAIHSKTDSDLPSFQTIHSDSHKEQNDQAKQPPSENKQKAIQIYQENIPASPKLSLGKVKDIMSQPIIQVFKNQSLEAAWELMQEYSIHHLIVLDDEYQYCGMLSETLILPYLMSYVQNPHGKRKPSELTLAIFCNQDLLSTHPETELHDLGVAMMEYGLDAVAVSENTNIVGIITKSDVFKVILKQQTFEELA